VSLLEIAKSDLEAAISLYEVGHYPQAIFQTQQSVEKCWKFVASECGFINDIDFKKIGHNPGKLFSKILSSELATINEGKFNNISESTAKIFNPEFVKSNIENSLNDLLQYSRGEIILSNETAVVMLHQLYKGEFLPPDSFEEQIIQQDQMLQFCKDLKIFDATPELLQNEKFQKFFSLRLEKFSAIFLKAVNAILGLSHVAFLFNNTVENSRYPEGKKTPEQIYDTDHVLVIGLPIIHNFMLKSIDQLFEFFEETRQPEKNIKVD
jgi:hypothetical protein